MYSIDTPEGMEAAKKWTTDTISMIKEGGVWMVPRSLTIYTIHHKDKYVKGGGDPSIDRVFKAMGWEIR